MTISLAPIPHSTWGHRIAVQVVQARQCARPAGLPRSRPRGSKGAGLRFERLVAKQFPGALHGPWFQFVDSYGVGYCQPDMVMNLKTSIVVVECKLTDTPAAQAQLDELYFPVLRKAFDLPVRGIIVVKNLRPTSELNKVVSHFDDALFETKFTPILHWLGRGSIM